MKIVGIDFGHGEISASFIDESKIVHQLKLVNTVDNVAEKWKIPSYLYKFRDAESGEFVYCLDKPNSAYTLISEMKKPISSMTEDEKEHYEAFIQLIFQRLKECNSELNNDDFELAIACPTKWSDEQKEEYKEFFNDALGDYGIEIYAIMNESDAAFFAKYNEDDYDKKVLVVDYGSSTIDFTLVSKGEKVDLDDMSSSNLGASAIEQAVLATYVIDKNSNYSFVHRYVDPIMEKYGLGWVDFDKFILAQIRENKEDMFTKRDQYLEEFRFTPFINTGIQEFRDRKYRFEYELGQPLMAFSPIEVYVNKVIKVLFELKNKAEHDGRVDKIIMSGGACMMKWVKNSIMDVFEIDENKIELDSSPAFVVCDGIVKYCQKYQECLDELFNKINAIDFEELLQKSDNDTVNDIAKSDIHEVMMNWKNNGSSITDLITNICTECYATYNSRNYKFVSSFKKKMSSEITSAVRIHVKSIIESIFKKKVDVNDFYYDYSFSPYYAYSEDNLKAICYYLFNYINETYTNWDWSFIHFYELNTIDYNKYRTPSERSEVINTFTDEWRFGYVFEDIDSKVLKGGYAKVDSSIIEDIKNEVLQYALHLIEEKQLFKTSFSQ